MLPRSGEVVPCRPQHVTDNDLFDNRLIFGDNLLALKALEPEFVRGIKCISSTRRTTPAGRSSTTTTASSTRFGLR